MFGLRLGAGLEQFLPTKALRLGGCSATFQSALNEKEPERRISVKHSLCAILTEFRHIDKYVMLFNGLFASNQDVGKRHRHFR